MDFRPSFKKILADKIGEDGFHQEVFQNTLASEPAHLSYLMGRIQKTDIHLGRHKYPHTPRVRPPHKLTAPQTVAFEFLKTIVTDLSEAFTVHELRRAFRKAALKIHPDHGGSAADFISLKSHYTTLQNFFKP